MNGFALFRKDREKQGGVIFLKSNIRCKRLVVPDLPEGVTEILWLQTRPGRLAKAA